MARGRMIDKRISNSKKLGLISDKGRVLWFMIYPHLDRDGRIAFDDLGDLKAEIIPLFEKWSLKKITQALIELDNIGLIKLYSYQKKEIAVQYSRFRDFQTGMRYKREAKSIVPSPGKIRGKSGPDRRAPDFSPKEGRKEGIKINGNSSSCSSSFSSMREKLREEEGGSSYSKELTFNVKEKKFQNLTEEDLQRWKMTYPHINIEVEILRMEDWIISNWASGRGRKKDWPRFARNWLAREKDKAKSGIKPGGLPPDIKAWVNEKGEHKTKLPADIKALIEKNKKGKER